MTSSNTEINTDQNIIRFTLTSSDEDNLFDIFERIASKITELLQMKNLGSEAFKESVKLLEKLEILKIIDDEIVRKHIKRVEGITERRLNLLILQFERALSEKLNSEKEISGSISQLSSLREDVAKINQALQEKKVDMDSIDNIVLDRLNDVKKKDFFLNELDKEVKPTDDQDIAPVASTQPSFFKKCCGACVTGGKKKKTILK